MTQIGALIWGQENCSDLAGLTLQRPPERGDGMSAAGGSARAVGCEVSMTYK